MGSDEDVNSNKTQDSKDHMSVSLGSLPLCDNFPFARQVSPTVTKGRSGLNGIERKDAHAASPIKNRSGTATDTHATDSVKNRSGSGSKNRSGSGSKNRSGDYIVSKAIWSTYLSDTISQNHSEDNDDKILALRGSAILTREGGFVNGYNDDIINDKNNASLPLSTAVIISLPRALL